MYFQNIHRQCWLSHKREKKSQGNVHVLDYTIINSAVKKKKPALGLQFYFHTKKLFASFSRKHPKYLTIQSLLTLQTQGKKKGVEL